MDASFWENQTGDDDGAAVAAAQPVGGLQPGSSSVVPPFRSDGKVQFYWVDACEDPQAFPGTVYLFGKVYVPEQKAFASCCVEVQNMDRCMLFLPRKFKVHRTRASEYPPIALTAAARSGTWRTTRRRILLCQSR